MNAMIKFTAVGLLALAGSLTSAQPIPYVAFTAIVEHPALDAVREGALLELKERGYDAANGSLRMSFDSAQGQPGNAAQIATKLVGAKPDVIVAISTPSAQSVAASTADIPIVFSAVTDPVDSKLVKSWEQPGANVTGVSDMAPVARQLDIAKVMVPNLKTLGVIYNAGESNSISLIRVVREEAAKRQIKLLESTAVRSADLTTAAERLVGRVELIYLPTDNVVASGLEAAVKVALDNHIPTLGDAPYAPRGVLVGSGYDYMEVGRTTGDMIAQILGGKAASSIAVSQSPNIEIVLNHKVAGDIGYTFPEALVRDATQQLR